MGLLGSEIHEQGNLDVQSRLIGEMGGVDVGTEIPTPQALIDKIKAKDEDPKFAVFEIEAGRSGSNRNWKPEHLEKMAKIINEKRPVGYKGHISEADDSSAFPTIHALWLGAKVVYEGGKALLRAKCYLKTKEIRDEVELEMVTGISPRGDSRLRPAKGGGYDVVDFDMESMDFSRKLRNGLPARLVSVTAEQITKSERGTLQVEPREITALGEDELRAHNPLLVQAIENKATQPLTVKIGEMETRVGELEPNETLISELREKLGISEDKNIVEAVGELVHRIESAASTQVKDFVKSLIEGKVKDEPGRRLVHRLVGEQIEEEFKGRDLDEGTKKEITEKFDGAVESDEDIKATIGEMTDTRERTNGGSGGGHDLGGRRGQPREPENGRKSRTGGVKFGKSKIR